MARRIRAFDWGATALGPIESWPQSQKTAIEIMLTSGYAMQLAWGPQRIVLYNDAYAPMLGSLHPGALGLPLRDAWPDLWSEIEPLVERVFAGETVRYENLALVTTRHGYPENTRWNFSYSPVRDESGAVAGLLNVTVDATALREGGAGHRLLIERWAQAVWETDATGVVVTDSPSWRAYTGQTVEEWLGYGWLDAIHPDDRAYAEKQWREAMAARSLVNAEFRLRAPNGGWRWTNVRAAPVCDEAGKIETWAAINIDIDARKQAEAELRESEERKAFLLSLADALRSISDAAEMRAIATKRLGEHLQVIRASFFEIDADQENFTQGVSYEAGSFHLPHRMRLSDFDRDIADAYRAGRTYVVCDTETDPRLEEKREAYRAIDLRAWIATPLVNRGRLFSVLGVNHNAPRHWTASEVTLVEEVGDRLWSAVERAHAEAAVRKSEERQALLLKVSDTLRPLIDAEDIQRVTGRLAAEHWGMANANYVRIETRHGVPYAIVRQSYAADGRPSVDGDYPLADFPAFTGRMLSGEKMMVTEVASDPNLTELDKANWKAMDLATLLSVSLVKGGRLVACFAVHGPQPKQWTLADAELLEEIAERTWASVERTSAEAALRASEERFHQFANASAAAVWIRDAKTLSMEFVSPAIEAMYGVRPDEFLGDLRHWASTIVPEDRDVAIGHLEQARQGKAVIHQFRIQRATDQAFRWIRNTDFPLYDEHGRVQRIGGIAEDVTETKLAMEHQAVLLAELQHRVRNIMAMIRSVAARTEQSAQSVADYAALLSGRLMALARTQTLLTRAVNVGVQIGALIEEELKAQAHSENQYELYGPPLVISPKAAEVLALAVHELTTNALKYGALATPEGKVAVSWRVEQADGTPLLRFDWKERRTPPPDWKPPTRRGFGSALVERRVPYELHGRGKIGVRPEGAEAWIEFPLREGDSILETDAPIRTSVHGGSMDMTGQPSLKGRTILVLEDDYYLAEDAGRALRGAGAEVAGPFPNEGTALTAIVERRVDLAVVDINLGAGPSYETAQALRRADIPFVFLTGYDQNAIPSEFADVQRLQKPVDLREIVRALAKLTSTSVAGQEGSPA